MSGDVQPRRRKDKRRKKDEAPGQEEFHLQTTPASAPDEYFNIHLHNDHGTGGGVCAKLVFFLLLSVLAVLIGMIFIEKRGLTDYTAHTESRFAKVFDGWIDESFNDHEEDDYTDTALDHNKDEEHEESEEEYQASVEKDHKEHEEEEKLASEENHREDDEAEEDQISEEDEEEQHANEKAEEEEEEQAESEEIEEEETEEEYQLSEEKEMEEKDQEISEENQLRTKEEDETNRNEADVGEDANVYEVEAESSSEAVNEEDTNENNDSAAEVDDNNEEDNDDTAETDEYVNANQSDEKNEDSNEYETEVDDNISKENEIIEDSAENIADTDGDDQDYEEVVDNTAGEEEALKEETGKQEVTEEESSNMAVKFGVGVALAVVAHIVLVRKWRSGKPNGDKSIQKEEQITDLSQRNRIVPPVPLEQIENDIQNLDEDEYSEEEVKEESDEESIMEPVHVKKSYHKLPLENLSKALLESKLTSQQRILYYEDDPREDEYDDEEEEQEDVEEDYEDIENEEVVGEGDELEEVNDEEEVEENDEMEISDADDEELLKKLEIRYGKLPSTKVNIFDDGEKNEDKFDLDLKKIKVLLDNQDTESEENPWTKKDSVPANLQQKLKFAESNLRDNPELAQTIFTNLMEQLPNNNRIKYGRAQAIDHLAELKRSNQLLQDAISSYYNLMQSSTVSDKLYLIVAERCIDRIRFRGHYHRAVQVHKEIISRFPNTPSHRNQLSVTLLTFNRLAEAKPVLQEVLSKWPDDGLALAHYGFILKIKDNDLKAAIKYLKQGIKSRVPGVIDGRFYFHLGDALTRLGRNDEAMNVYEDGVKHNVFLSKYQRSLYNIDRLTAKPWWLVNQTPYAPFFKLLEEKWKTIREEGLALLNKAGYFHDETENLRDTGLWKQFELFARGQKLNGNCNKCPQTCSLIDNFPDARGCRRGQVKFSIMHPGTHIWPHCGPSNCRLRAHLGLKIPSNTFIRVADDIRTWSEGKVLIFDDSFEHEVWHNGSEVRLVLIVDVWHPELTAHEKRSLPAI